MATTGTIGVTTENIFPVIKKFLYSDHEIFLRELVANAVDATQKMKALAASGEYNGELGELAVRIELDEAARTLKIIDNGIGMTAEEVDKYINQIAFSSAGEFLEKYKDQLHHRPLRTRLLFCIHGSREGYHRDLVLERRCKGSKMVMRRFP